MLLQMTNHLCTSTPPPPKKARRGNRRPPLQADSCLKFAPISPETIRRLLMVSWNSHGYTLWRSVSYSMVFICPCVNRLCWRRRRVAIVVSNFHNYSYFPLLFSFLLTRRLTKNKKGETSIASLQTNASSQFHTTASSRCVLMRQVAARHIKMMSRSGCLRSRARLFPKQIKGEVSGSSISEGFRLLHPLLFPCSSASSQNPFLTFSLWKKPSWVSHPFDHPPEGQEEASALAPQ